MKIARGITTLYVADVDRSIQFYTKVLGLRLRMRVEDEWAEIEVGDSLVLGLHRLDEDIGHTAPSGTPLVRIGFEVEEGIEQVVERLSENGVEFDGPILDDVAPVRLAFFSDEDGHSLYLFQYRRSFAGNSTG